LCYPPRPVVTCCAYCAADHKKTPPKPVAGLEGEALLGYGGLVLLLHVLGWNLLSRAAGVDTAPDVFDRNGVVDDARSGTQTTQAYHSHL
jgi:hypothetical protein